MINLLKIIGEEKQANLFLLPRFSRRLSGSGFLFKFHRLANFLFRPKSYQVAGNHFRPLIECLANDFISVCGRKFEIVRRFISETDKPTNNYKFVVQTEIKEFKCIP